MCQNRPKVYVLDVIIATFHFLFGGGGGGGEHAPKIPFAWTCIVPLHNITSAHQDILNPKFEI